MSTSTNPSTGISSSGAGSGSRNDAKDGGGAKKKGFDFGQWWNMVKSAASAWIDDYAPSMGAALAYYTVFSVAPLLLIVISIAGLVFGAEAARGAIVEQLQGMMGTDAAKAIEGLIESVSKPEKSAAATAVGIVVLLIGATTVFGELQDALDRIWRAPARPEGGLWSLLRARLLSFGMILGIGFLLMVSLVLSAALSALGKWWGPMFGGWQILAQLLNFAVSFGLVTAVFAMIYKIMPRVQVRWHDVWIGAAVTSLLFTIGKSLIGLYIGKSGVASGYGAAGSLVVVLVWVYYSAQIFLMGAEFTWVYAHTFGSLQGQPMPHAQPGTTASPGGEAGKAAAQAAGAKPAPSRDDAKAPPKPPVAVSPAALAPASPKEGEDEAGLYGKPLATLVRAAATTAALHAIVAVDEHKRRIDEAKARRKAETEADRAVSSSSSLPEPAAVQR